MMIKKIIFVFGLLLIPVFSMGALLEDIAVSTKALSLANAVTAYPPGLMSIHYNPAGLSHMREGAMFSTTFIGAYLRMKHEFKADPDFEGFLGEYNNDPLDGTTAINQGLKIYIPVLDESMDTSFMPWGAAGGPLSNGISYRAPGSRWTFAYAAYMPFGGGFIYEDDSAIRFGGKSVYLQHLLYAAPAVSYRLTSQLSVGLSIGIGQTAMGLETDARAPNDMTALTRLLGDTTKDLNIPFISDLTLPGPWFGGGIHPYEKVGSIKATFRDDFTPSYNIGLLWEPKNWISFGACYRSATKINLQGPFTLKYDQNIQNVIRWLGSTPTTQIMAGMFNLPTRPVTEQKGQAMVQDMEFPQSLNTGIMLRPMKKLRLMFDLHWANWSSMKYNKLVFDQDIQLLQIIFLMGYNKGPRTLIMDRKQKDTWNLGMGVEYQVFDWLALRAGYERRRSSIKKDLYDTMIALPDLDFFGTGLGITHKSGLSIDLAMSYLFHHNYKVPNNTSHNMNSTDFTDVIYNPYAGLDYEQDVDLAAVSANFTMPLFILGELIKWSADMVMHPMAGFEALTTKKTVYHRKFETGMQTKTQEQIPEAEAEPFNLEDIEAEMETAIEIEPQVRPATEQQKFVYYPYSLELGRYDSAEAAQADLINCRQKNIQDCYRVRLETTHTGVEWILYAGFFRTAEDAAKSNMGGAVVSPTPWACFIGLFTNAQELNSITKYLQTADFDIYQIPGKNGTRLFSGAFANQEDAKTYQQAMAAKYIISEVIKR